MVKEGKIANIVRVILVVAAIAITSFGLLEFTKVTSFKADATKVKAIISNVDSKIGVSGGTEYTAYVTYKHKGEEYENVLIPYYKSYMYEKYELKDFYVNNNNPKEFIIESDEIFMPKLMVVIGVLIVAVVIFTIFIEKNKKKKLLNLKVVGIKKDGIIKSGKKDMTYSEKGKHPYRFECTYEDEISGNPTYCTSLRTWEKPDEYIGEHIDIYVDKNNHSFYYVDLEKVILEHK